jgi:ABC-type antimicrobial peptide transport system permease subunit
MLLVCAGMLLRAFALLLRTDPGFTAKGVASFELQLPRERYRDGEAVLRDDAHHPRVVIVDSLFAARVFLGNQEVVDEARGTPRFVTALGSLFGLLALGMAALGLFGVLSFSVQQRTREIGVRMALGAGEARVLRMMLAEGLRLTLIGIAMGTGGALLCSRALAAAVEGVRPNDALTWFGAPLLLLAVAMLACLVPARRAARVDPMVALNDG